MAATSPVLLCTVDTIFYDIIPSSDKYQNIDILEVFFVIFNDDNLDRTKFPLNYSLSVGDILEFDGVKHQVMGCGFKELLY